MTSKACKDSLHSKVIYFNYSCEPIPSSAESPRADTLSSSFKSSSVSALILSCQSLPKRKYMW